jgi:hypothetical protein
MTAILLAIIGGPAVLFFLIAIAFGLNPVRSFAVGALCGIVGLGAIIGATIYHVEHPAIVVNPLDAVDPPPANYIPEAQR